MTDTTYAGPDGVERDLEVHRGFLQRELDEAVTPSSPRFDEGYASKLRAELAALPPPVRAPHSRTVTHRHAREPRSSASVTPKVVLVFDGEGDVATIEEFLAAGPDAAHEILASGRKKLKPSSLLRRVLRTLLAAKVERYP